LSSFFYTFIHILYKDKH